MAATADARRSGESPLPEAAALAEGPGPVAAEGPVPTRPASSGLLSRVRLASNAAVIRWSSSPSSSSLCRWRYHFSPLRSSSST